MKFSKTFLQDVACRDTEEAEVVHEEITDTSRWSIHYEQIFKYQDHFYVTYFSRGATEQQDESPYEYDSDEIDCDEVHQVEKLVKVWQKLNKD